MPILSHPLSSIPNIVHSFGDQSQPLKSTPEIESRLPIWKQTHGTRSVEVIQIQQACGECDALWTQRPHLPIAIRTADCVPILVAHKKAKAVAAIHSGWRGTLAHISSHVWTQLSQIDSDPGAWTVALGPSIRSCCYQVSIELVESFKKEFGFNENETWLRADRFIDLPSLIQSEWQKFGVTTIDLAAPCTACTQSILTKGGSIYHSFRRDKDNGRQFSTIEIIDS